MLVGAKLRTRFVRRPAGRNNKDAIEVKAALRGARHRDMARVNGVEGAAEKRDLPASGFFRAAFRSGLRLQISSATIKICAPVKLFFLPQQATAASRRPPRLAT